MSDIVREITTLRGEVAELKELILRLVGPATTMPTIDKARLIREAHASGDAAKIRKAHKLINGGKR